MKILLVTGVFNVSENTSSLTRSVHVIEEKADEYMHIAQQLEEEVHKFKL